MAQASTRSRLVAGWSLAASLACACACGRAHRPDRRSAEQLVLEHQVQALQALVRSSPAKQADDLVVSVEGQLIEDTLNAGTPWSREVGDHFVVEIQRAHVSLEGGVALIRLSGCARPRSAPDARASFNLYFAIDGAEIDPASHMLRASVSLIAFEAGEPDERNRPPSTDSVVDALGKLGLDAYAGLLSRIPVPVSIEEDIELPKLGPRPVSVPAMEFPASLKATGVWAFRRRLWVAFDGQVRPEARSPRRVSP